jgi:excisionase family DNA binding protein
MNEQTLPLPNIGDWCTVGGAARIMKKSRRTVERMVADGSLRGYLPFGAPDRIASRLLWRADVDELAAALERLRGARLRAGGPRAS